MERGKRLKEEGLCEKLEERFAQVDDSIHNISQYVSN